MSKKKEAFYNDVQQLCERVTEAIERQATAAASQAKEATASSRASTRYFKRITEALEKQASATADHMQVASQSHRASMNASNAYLNAANLAAEIRQKEIDAIEAVEARAKREKDIRAETVEAFRKDFCEGLRDMQVKLSQICNDLDEVKAEAKKPGQEVLVDSHWITALHLKASDVSEHIDTILVTLA